VGTLNRFFLLRLKLRSRQTRRKGEIERDGGEWVRATRRAHLNVKVLRHVDEHRVQ